MAMYKLSEVEAFRAQVLLEEALKKLEFLRSISSTSSGGHGDELTQFMGDEISRIITEQRELEKKYEDLIGSRGQLKGLCNKKEFTIKQEEIQDVARRLKESNKSLCRNLKENPNVPGNMLKLQAERAQVQEWLEETKTDLIEFSFAGLAGKVEAERKEQEKLNEMKKKESDSSREVKRLEADLQQEYTDYEKDTRQKNSEIKELKEDLQKNKTISEIEYKFEEKKLRAREQALLRSHAQMEKKLLEELRELEAAKSMEESVHGRAREFLEEKGHSLQALKDEWQKNYENEVAKKEVELTFVKERRNIDLEDLKEKQARCQQEALEHKAKEDEMRNAVLVEKQRHDQLQRMADAVLFLQEEGRAYMQRLAAKRAAQKGKKKKKGKKK